METDNSDDGSFVAIVVAIAIAAVAALVTASRRARKAVTPRLSGSEQESEWIYEYDLDGRLITNRSKTAKS